MKIKYILLGSKGQLAKEFQKNLPYDEYVAFSHKDLDVTKYDDLDKMFENYRPQYVINCSAYNLVDKAEESTKEVYAVNAQGPYNLAVLAKKYNSFLIHFSSDYVFDGKKNSPYKENDMPNPLNEYGKSKLEGEKYVTQILQSYLLFRLSWVYGDGSQNFISKLQSWASRNSLLTIADDEISVPTSTKTIVHITLSALNSNLKGLYHLTNSGYCSRFEWAQFIVKELHLDNKVKPVSKDTFNLLARRPDFSAMSNKKISTDLGIEIEHWQDALKSFIKTKKDGFL